MKDVVCPFCESVCKVVSDNLAECLICKEFFEIEDELLPKQIRTKPRKTEEEEWDDE